jgi:hypothetical protein
MSFGRNRLILVVRLSGVSSIDNLKYLLADIQSRLPVIDDTVRDILESVPSWFRELGTSDGIARLELRFGNSIPNALQLFYRYPALGCWLLVNHDTDIFLETGQDVEKPRTVVWYYRPHIVLATFHHSQSICAVQLGSEEPRIEWGYEGTKLPSDLPPCFFVQWLSRIAKELVDDLDAKQQ